MAGEVREILLRIRGDSREAQQAQAAVQTGFGGIASAAAIATAAVAAVAGGVATLVATINRGQGVSELSTAFDNLGGSLPRLRESTQGLVSDLDLMRASNQAMLAGLSATQFEQVAAAADALGDAVGVGTKEAMDGLTLSIASGNERMLKQFGILVDNKKAEEDFAASIGITADQLNEVGKREAFRIAALEEMAEKTLSLGEAQATAGDGLQKLDSSTDNLFDRFAQGVNENQDLAEAMDNLAKAVAAIDPTPLISLANGLVDLVAVPINYISDRVKIIYELGSAVRDLARSEEEREDMRFQAEVTDYRRRYEDEAEALDELAAQLDKASTYTKHYTEQTKDGQKALADYNKFGWEYIKWLRAANISDQFVSPWSAFEEDGRKALEKKKKDDEKAADDLADYTKEQNEKAYSDVVDFYGEALTGLIDGDIEDVLKDMLKRQAIQFGAELLASMTASFARAQGISLLGSTVGAGAGGVGAAGAGGLGGAGAAIPGIAPYAVGALAVYNAYSVATEGPDGAMFGFQRNLLRDTGFWGGKGEEQQRRDAGRSSLFDRGIIDSNHEFSLFGGGRGSLSPGGEFSGFSSGGEKYGGFGSVLSMASGGDNSLKELYANALSEADSFNSAAQTTIGLLSDMGVSAEESQQMLIDAYNEGAISLGEFNEGMDAAAILARDDLGSVEEGFQLLAETIDGPPKDSLKALQLTFAEIKQSGVQDTEGLLAVIEQKMGPEAREVFKRLADAGITQFTDFNTLSAGQIQLLFNEMTNLKQPFDDVGSAGESAGRRGADGLGKIESKLGDIKRKAKEAKDALEDVGNAV